MSNRERLFRTMRVSIAKTNPNIGKEHGLTRTPEGTQNCRNCGWPMRTQREKERTWSAQNKVMDLRCQGTVGWEMKTQPKDQTGNPEILGMELGTKLIKHNQMTKEQGEDCGNPKNKVMGRKTARTRWFNSHPNQVQETCRLEKKR